MTQVKDYENEEHFLIKLPNFLLNELLDSISLDYLQKIQRLNLSMEMFFLNESY
jgi:hypothetical protein